MARNSVDGGKVIYLVDTSKIVSLRFPIFSEKSDCFVLESFILEPSGGIGPPCTVYETVALPLSYGGTKRIANLGQTTLKICFTNLERDTRIELAP